jgi:hypothetical protein
MDQSGDDKMDHKTIILHKLWKDYEKIDVSFDRGGHGGGDKRLQEKIFSNPEMPDPYKRAAGMRDGAMSVLVGVAARKSIETGEPIRIASLTDLQPRVKRL